MIAALTLSVQGQAAATWGMLDPAGARSPELALAKVLLLLLSLPAVVAGTVAWLILRLLARTMLLALEPPEPPRGCVSFSVVSRSNRLPRLPGSIPPRGSTGGRVTTGGRGAGTEVRRQGSRSGDDPGEGSH